MPSPNISPTIRLFVGGLPYRITEGELLSLFATYGRIVALKIMHTKWGKSRGMGFVEFDNLVSAIDAKQHLHNYSIAEDRTIIVDYAAPDPVTHPELRSFSPSSRGDVLSLSKDRGVLNRGNNQSTSEKPRIHKPYVKKFGETNRQSVYDSRTHHSRVGAKFAKRKTR